MKRHKVNGYYALQVEGHPYGMSRGRTGNGWVYEHRHVMEQHLGRFLEPTEVVHHINFDRGDNRLENLGLLSSSAEHRLLHSILEGHAVISSETCSFCGDFLEVTEKAVAKRKSRSENLYCSHECQSKALRRVVRPDKETLEKEVWSVPTVQLAKKYEVSGKAIEKWCKSYGISKPPRGYWAK